MNVAIVLEESHGVDDAEMVARKIAAEMKSPFLFDGRILPLITTSIGVAILAGGEVDATSAIQSADSALYRTKHAAGTVSRWLIDATAFARHDEVGVPQWARSPAPRAAFVPADRSLVLRDQDAVISPGLCVSGEVAGLIECHAGGTTLSDAGELKNGEGNDALCGHREPCSDGEVPPEAYHDSFAALSPAKTGLGSRPVKSYALRPCLLGY